MSEKNRLGKSKKLKKIHPTRENPKMKIDDEKNVFTWTIFLNFFIHFFDFGSWDGVGRYGVVQGHGGHHSDQHDTPDPVMGM